MKPRADVERIRRRLERLDPAELDLVADLVRMVAAGALTARLVAIAGEAAMENAVRLRLATGAAVH